MWIFVVENVQTINPFILYSNKITSNMFQNDDTVLFGKIILPRKILLERPTPFTSSHDVNHDFLKAKCDDQPFKENSPSNILNIILYRLQIPIELRIIIFRYWKILSSFDDYSFH